jgi:4-hydroxy-2-oxoheptanedioate aldolase
MPKSEVNFNPQADVCSLDKSTRMEIPLHRRLMGYADHVNLRSSRILRELKAGRTPTCFKLNLGDPRVIELCGLAGVSSVWICNEHVSNDWFNLENQIRAAKLYDVDTIVRVEKGSYSDFVKPFEADATAIMVPHVRTPEEARQIVQMTRFHPLGRRALDGGNPDGRYCQVPVAEYMAHSNSEKLLIFQIECPVALENVEAIAAVPGFDMLLFGPGDFSHLIGKPGQVNAPEVVAARKRVGAVAKKYGKYAMAPGMMAPRAVLQEEGYNVFTLGADVLGLGEYFRAQLAALNATVPKGSTHSPYEGAADKSASLRRAPELAEPTRARLTA